MKNENTKWHARQGDVLIERIDKPTGVELKPVKGPVILAEGEATGHHHAIAEFRGIRMAGTMNPAIGQEMILSIPAPIEVTHQEHAPIQLPKGTYRMTRQREYSPRAVRNVAD